MSEVMTLGDVERLCWTLSGWQVEQRDVDRLLAAVEAYARGTKVPAQPRRGPEGGPGEAERPQEATEAPVAVPETPAPVPVAQKPAQAPESIEGAYVLTVTRVEKPVRVPRKVYPVPRADFTERTRICRKCGLSYPIESFSRDKSSRGGRKTACTPCENVRRRDARRDKRAADRAARGEA